MLNLFLFVFFFQKKKIENVECLIILEKKNKIKENIANYQ